MRGVRTFEDSSQLKLHLQLTPELTRVVISDRLENFEAITRLVLTLDINSIGGTMDAEVEAEIVDSTMFNENGELNFHLANSKYSIVEGFLLLKKSPANLIEEHSERIITV